MADKANPVVAMRSVTKRFLDVTANNKVNFELFPGEICALLGENGAGKTTLMNILFGYYICDEGEIFIKGEKTELTSPRDAISQGIGMIHQHFTLPNFTIPNVISLWRKELAFGVGHYRLYASLRRGSGTPESPNIR